MGRALYERIADDVESLYWDNTFGEIADELGVGTSTVQRAKDHLGLPSKTTANRLKYKYGVPVDWLLDTLHNTLGKSVNQMSDDLDVSRRWISSEMDEREIYRRGQSEAEQHKWSEMSEEERQQQVAAAHEKTRQLAKTGEHTFQQLWREKPEKMKEHVQEVAHLGTPARDENGIAGRTGEDNPMGGVTGEDHHMYGVTGEDHPSYGITGQDHHSWRGGKDVYDALKKQLHGPSWETLKKRQRGDECKMCGATDDLHLHHIVPLLSGGTNGPFNLLTLCRSCHTKVESFTRQSFADDLFTE